MGINGSAHDRSKTSKASNEKERKLHHALRDPRLSVPHWRSALLAALGCRSSSRPHTGCPATPVDRFELKVHPPLPLMASPDSGSAGQPVCAPPPGARQPRLVLDAQGNLLRSWGKVCSRFPTASASIQRGTSDGGRLHVHGIQVHAGRQQLLAIRAGDVPDPCRNFCGATDVAFAQNGHVLASMATATRASLSTMPEEARCVNGENMDPARVNSAWSMPSLLVRKAMSMWPTVRTAGLQWFDPPGAVSRQWTYGGQLFTGVQPRWRPLRQHASEGVSWDMDFNVLKIDLASGTMLGRLEVRTHELTIAPRWCAFACDVEQPVAGVAASPMNGRQGVL